METATTAVDTGTRDVTAGKTVVEKLAKLQKRGNHEGRNLKMKKIRESQPMHAHTLQKTNPMAISDHAEPHGTYSLVAQDDSSIPKLYDSGVSWHLSPCHKQLLNFTTIPARPIRGANKTPIRASS